MKKEKTFTEEDLQVVYAALITMSEELAVMRKKADRICAQTPAIDGISYILGKGKERPRATAE